MINEREYLFASSFLKASDAEGTPADRLARFGAAADPEALRGAVREACRLAPNVPGERVYDEAFADAVRTVRSAVPDFGVFGSLLYKYDCTNIKTAIKCALRGTSPDGLMFSCGTVAPETVLDGARSASFHSLPPHMNKAAGDAMHRYRKMGEARIIDLMLDTACFADMKESAAASGVDLLGEIVTVRADGTNAVTAQRIKAQGMPPETASALLREAYVPGGDLPVSALISPDGGCGDIKDAAQRLPFASPSAPVLRACAAENSFSGAQKVIDEAVLRLCDKYRFKPFGAESVVRYLVIREAEMTNCRILEAGMRGGCTEKMRERLRRAYV